MNYQDFEPDNEEKKSGKVFYWVLAACMIAVCGAIVTTVAGTLPKDIPEETESGTTITTTVKTTSSVQQVVIPATDIPDERTTTTSVTTTTTNETADLFVLPVSNRVLLPFSETLQYSETLGEWRTHNGTDFEAKENQSVKAVADGTIQTITKDAVWGNIIEIDHGGKRISRYCGVTAAGIKKGDHVKAGSVIGKVSGIPSEISNTPHIHLEILINDKYLDPLTLLQGETVTVPSK